VFVARLGGRSLPQKMDAGDPPQQF
jgi:hypothetical protein